MLPPAPPPPQLLTSPSKDTLTPNSSICTRRRFLNPIKQATTASVAAGNIGLPRRPRYDVVAELVTVSVVFADATPEGATVAGRNAQVAPAGSPEQLNETIELNPFAGVTVTVVVPLCPAVTVIDVGEVATVKLGGGRLMV